MKNNIRKHNERANVEALKSKSNKRDGSYASVQERFKKLKKGCNEEICQVPDVLICGERIDFLKKNVYCDECLNKFKDLKKEIENKTYGCGKDSFEEGILVPFKCGRKLRNGEIDLCEEHKAEKEADEKILKQIKEILK